MRRHGRTRREQTPVALYRSQALFVAPVGPHPGPELRNCDSYANSKAHEKHVQAVVCNGSACVWRTCKKTTYKINESAQDRTEDLLCVRQMR